MTDRRRLTWPALLVLPLLLGGLLPGDLAGLREASASAPHISWTYRDPVHKFSLRMFRDYKQIPVKVGEKTTLCKFRDAKSKGTLRGSWPIEIEVVRVTEKEEKPVTTGAAEKPKTPAERLKEAWERAMNPKTVWDATVGQWQLPASSREVLAKARKKFEKIESDDHDAVPGRLWQFDVPAPRGGEALHVTLAEFRKDGVAYGVCLMCGEKLERHYARPFARIAKSFKWHDDRAKDVKSLSVLDGLNISARKRRQIEESMVKGWDVIVSPHKNYIIIYNTKRGTNHLLARVIAERIEAIRKQVYEVQFPPTHPIKTVCIVRVCADAKEYHAYGGPGGSAGYWSDQDEELVFYDASASKKPDDDTLSVLYHEAFHQYIYYAVGNVAPHSWFNEGHGDYYAGARYVHGRFRIEPFRWRVGTIKKAIVQGPRTYTQVDDGHGGTRKQWGNTGFTPLKDLVRFSQAEYYAYPGVCYAEGWSLIYFLREIVPKNRKYREKWGHILDTYFDVLKREVNRKAPLVPGGENPGDDDGGDRGSGTSDGGADDGGGDGHGKAHGPGTDEGGGKADGGTGSKGDGRSKGDGDGKADGGSKGDGSTDGKADGGSKGDGDGKGDGGEQGGSDEPPPDVARTYFRGRGGPEALRKAVDEAFKGVDWDEFQKAWMEAIKHVH